MENSGQSVIKFTGENWITWKFQVVVTLKAKNVYNIVTGIRQKTTAASDDWDKLDAKAQEIIVTRMKEGPLVHSLSCQTSHEMWEKLLSVYEKKSKVIVFTYCNRGFLLWKAKERIYQYSFLNSKKSEVN
ncbi:copia protein [Lasius niger]|uniref:Copia protein n=1 Tax=Lasius niger TaxID=67767 RepID=A0A0J7K751_LASNI|nr:copia protein [Lasius niger]